MKKVDDEYPKVYLYRRIVQSKLFMDEQYATVIPLETIADEAFFSKFHFMRLFKQTYGKTPHQYLIGVRIEKAKLLLQANRIVSEVCYDVGFDSITSFTNLFKKRVGQSPAAYRRQQAERKANIESDPLKYVPNCFAEQKGWKGPHPSKLIQ